MSVGTQSNHLRSDVLRFLFVCTVNSIALVKPEKARAVENILIQMAQTGQIVGKVTVVISVGFLVSRI